MRDIACLVRADRSGKASGRRMWKDWVILSKRLDVPVFVKVQQGVVFLFGIRSLATGARRLECKIGGDAHAPRYAFLSYRAGYVPRELNEEEWSVLEILLNETYGVMLREESGNVSIANGRQVPVNARVEGLDGKWRDGTFKLPPVIEGVRLEVALPKARCEMAAKLIIRPTVEWEIDVLERNVTHESRSAYLFCGADRALKKCVFTGRVQVAEPKEPYRVEEDGEEAMSRMRNALPSQLLEVILATKFVPGAIHVRSDMMMALVRPLTAWMPFRLVREAKLDALEEAIRHV